jgi:Flp pilus assembly pilin Flp
MTGESHMTWHTQQALFRELVADERGQDIVEYGLLGAILGIAAIAIWQQLNTTVGTVYGAADSGVQNLSACTPDPGGGGCP